MFRFLNSSFAYKTSWTWRPFEQFDFIFLPLCDLLLFTPVHDANFSASRGHGRSLRRQSGRPVRHQPQFARQPRLHIARGERNATEANQSTTRHPLNHFHPSIKVSVSMCGPRRTGLLLANIQQPEHASVGYLKSSFFENDTEIIRISH